MDAADSEIQGYPHTEFDTAVFETDDALFQKTETKHLSQPEFLSVPLMLDIIIRLTTSDLALILASQNTLCENIHFEIVEKKPCLLLFFLVNIYKGSLTSKVRECPWTV